ncbi:MAG: hypothetical protein J5I28_02815 [Acidimicrobiales bacterium]|jgi:hypothetical protein|nr:hypothetical protein [Acidimicrobiales bacterium]HLV90138.1 hypothetical protein [Acidimicrobiia bacterium]
MEFLVPGFGAVHAVTGFWQRWRGLRGSPDGSALALPGGSVHGFGMDRDLVVVGLDGDLEVIGSKVLAPNRIVTIPGARWMIELPAGTIPPPAGTRLIVHG